MKIRKCTCGIENEVVQGIDYCQNCGDFIAHLPIKEDTPVKKEIPSTVKSTESKSKPKSASKKKKGSK